MRSILFAFFFSTIFVACTDNTCKDVQSLNLGIDDDCKYSRATFYVSNGIYFDRNLNLFAVERVEIRIFGQSIGEIKAIGIPNNCTNPQNVTYQFTSGSAVDWSAIITLDNGQTVTNTGTLEPSPNNSCIIVKAG